MKVHLRALIGASLAFALFATFTPAPMDATFGAEKIAKTSLSIKSATPVSGMTVVSGDGVVLAGIASTNLAGKSLRVEIKKGKKWVAYSGRSKVASDGSFAITTTAFGVGKTQYRVSWSGNKSLAPASDTKRVTVSKWFPLVEQEIVDDNSWYYNSPRPFNGVHVAGKEYGTALTTDTYIYSDESAGWSEFNLGFHCSTMSTIIGLDDDSESGSKARFTIFVDGNSRYSKDLGIGQTATAEISLADGFRLRLQNAGLSDDYGAYPAWPTARILCSERPK